MELIKANFINTTSSIVVNSNTATAEHIMNPDVTFQHVSSGFNNDLTTSTITINFDETLSVSRIAMVGMNLKDFNLFYNGTTANTFAITSTSATTVSQWTSNSETSMYLPFTAVNATSVTLDMKKTLTANSEKAIGYLVVSEEHIDFTRIPAAKNYAPVLDSQDVVHVLSDGNTRIQFISDKWSTNVKLEYITEAFRNSLKTVFDLHDGMVFVAFGTSTSWDEVIYPCVWEAPFEFFSFSDNAPSAGFSGTLRLKETTPS